VRGAGRGSGWLRVLGAYRHCCPHISCSQT
jgi:hypothetical protein